MTAEILTLAKRWAFFVHDHPSYWFYMAFHPVMQYIYMTFIVLAVYLFYAAKHRDETAYQTEAAMFNGFETAKSWKPQNHADSAALLIFIAAFAFYLWNIFYAVGVKHGDAIGPINGLACRGDWTLLSVWVDRFFPLGHQEFGFLGQLGILSLLDCSYAFLYSLVLIQLCVTVYFFDKILPFEKLWQRMMIILLIFSSVSLMRPLSHLFIPDRNIIFLVVLFLYNVIQFYRFGRYRNLGMGLFFANVSIYFKEPMFLFYGGFASASLLLKLRDKQINFVDSLQHPIIFIRRYPLEVGLLMMAMFFAIIFSTHFLFVTVVQNALGSGRSPDYWQYFQYIFWQFPLFTILPFFTVLVIKDFKKLHYQYLIVPLLVGGFLYLLIPIKLTPGIQNFYYYCIGYLAILLSLCYYLVRQKNRWLWTAIAVFILYSQYVNIPQLVQITSKEKATKIRIHALTGHFDDYRGQDARIYYGSNSLVASTVMYQFLSVAVHDTASFHLYTSSGCKQWWIDRDKTIFPDVSRSCSKADMFDAAQYDIVILERKLILDDEWERLSSSYRAYLTKITDYPSFLHRPEKDDWYILEGHR